MKRTSVFPITAMLALFFWQWAFFTFDRHFNGLTEAKKEIGLLKREIERSNVRTEVVKWQLDLFKQEVAKAAPMILKDLPPEAQKDVRGIASVVQSPPDEFLLLSQFETSIEDLRVLFEKQRYKDVITKANNILGLNPVSASMVSVYFMLAEAHYQNHDLEACFAVAQQMIQLFPDHEKTGYVLLRVGMFLKEKNRLEESKNMFSLVNNAFAWQSDLKEKSQKFIDSFGGVE